MGGGGGGKPPSRPFNGNNRNQVFDSNGPDGRIRGNAHQVMERYIAMARDATSQGDRIAAENYYQHAEHYFRLLSAFNQANPPPRRPQTGPGSEEEMGEGADNNGNNNGNGDQPMAGDYDGNTGDGDQPEG